MDLEEGVVENLSFLTTTLSTLLADGHRTKKGQINVYVIVRVCFPPCCKRTGEMFKRICYSIEFKYCIKNTICNYIEYNPV